MTEKRSPNVLFNRIFRKRYFVIVPLLVLFLAGWSFNKATRDSSFPAHGEIFENSKGIVNVGSRKDLCDQLLKPNGYLLLNGSLTLTEVGNAQGFWQTDDIESGIFFELDNTLIRIGVALADGTTSRSALIGDAYAGQYDYVVLLQGNGKLDLLINQTKSIFQLGKIDPTCNNLRIGMGNEQETFSGSITTEVSAGADSSTAIAFINTYTQWWNIQNKLNQLGRPVIFVAGLLIVFGNPFKPQKQDEESQTELV